MYVRLSRADRAHFSLRLFHTLRQPFRAISVNIATYYLVYSNAVFTSQHARRDILALVRKTRLYVCSFDANVHGEVAVGNLALGSTTTSMASARG